MRPAEGRIILHSGTQAMGQGLQTTYRADGGGVARRLHRQGRCGAGRYRSGHRLRQRRLALAVRRRHGGGGLGGDLIAKAREKASQMLEASVEDIEYRDGYAHRGRHRQTCRPVRHRQKGSRRAAFRRQRRPDRRPELAEWHAYLRSRDRSGDRRHARGALHHGRRCRRRHQSDAGDRTGARRRRAGHRPGAV